MDFLFQLSAWAVQMKCNYFVFSGELTILYQYSFWTHAYFQHLTLFISSSVDYWLMGSWFIKSNKILSSYFLFGGKKIDLPTCVL